ncbi:MAG: O-acetyl-ADP-ribose deacetylase [Acidimicrobiia bacterium]|nr:O-acetyl-ADP-ribose deacetylase [Acidimicrobiia bacterium]
MSARLEVVQGDITRERVDAIVNAANERLARGGGVCGAIHAAGGPEIARECATIGHCPTGSAVATTAGDLPARFVIHAVGPVWRGGRSGEADLLAACYRRALEVADEVGARSVAIPAISTGIFGYPLEEATAIAVGTVRRAETAVTVVRFVCFDDATAAAYRRALDRPATGGRGGPDPGPASPG